MNNMPPNNALPRPRFAPLSLPLSCKVVMFCRITSERVRRFLWLAALPLTLAPSARGEGKRTSEEHLPTRLQEIGIPFIANSGQIDPAVAYYAQTFAGACFVTQDGRIVYSLAGERALVGRSSNQKRRPGWSLSETTVGGRAHPMGSDPASTGVSYFLGGDPAR